MNVHAKPEDFTAPAEVLTAEQSAIARLLVEPERIGDVLARVKPTEFTHPVHVRLVSLIDELSREGRTPSVQSILAVMGEHEVEPGYSARRYLLDLVRAHDTAPVLPLADALEVIRDAYQRHALRSIGTVLTSHAGAQAACVADIASGAVHALDDVLSSLRTGKRHAYTAKGLADAALEHIDADDKPLPTTGLADLDYLIGGWPIGELTIWAGRPGMGKSACATSAVLRAARAGHGVGFFSLEMHGIQIGSRMLTDLAYTGAAPIMYEDILRRRVESRARDRLEAAAAELDSLPIKAEEQRGLTLAEIASRARKMANAFDKEGRKLTLLVVDHMGLVVPSSHYRGSRVNEVGEISNGLATLAKDLDCAVVALCQLNRGVEGRENKRPGLSDLRDSGSIEQDASLVVFSYRPAYYLKDRLDDPTADAARQMALEACRHKLELIIAKNRNGSIGTVDAFVDIGANAIRNASYSR